MVDTKSNFFIYWNLKSPNDLQFYGKLLEAFECDSLIKSQLRQDYTVYNMSVCVCVCVCCVNQEITPTISKWNKIT